MALPSEQQILLADLKALHDYSEFLNSSAGRIGEILHELESAAQRLSYRWQGDASAAYLARLNELRRQFRGAIIDLVKIATAVYELSETYAVTDRAAAACLPSPSE